jgi:predicted acetyltransferase
MMPRGESMLTHTRAPAIDVPFFYRFHRAARTIAGEMVRIVRLPDAFAAHPMPARSGVSGSVGLDLTDPVFSDQNGPFDLTVDAKGARVKKGRASKARVALGIGALSQIYTGAARARALLEAGTITGDVRVADLLDAAFACPASFAGDLNGY